MTAMFVGAVAVLAALVTAAVQWAVLRSRHRRLIAGLQSRHLQQQLNLTRKLDQAKRHIARLQQEGATVRLELKQRRERRAPASTTSMSTNEALSRELDAAPLHHRVPADGFADTMPSPQYPHADELLLR